MNSLRGLAVGMALIGLAGPVNADGIDRILERNIRTVLDQLDDAKLDSVGVLKGELQTGGPSGPVTLQNGKLGELLAQRLENMIILSLDQASPQLHLARSASAAAAKLDPQANYATPEARAKLFQPLYPAAWGKAQLRVTAFLVPRFTLDENVQIGTLTLSYFTADDPKTLTPLKLAHNRTLLTRQMLIDLDQPFIVPNSLFQKRGGEGDAPDELTPSALEKALQPIRTNAAADGKQPEIFQPNKPRPQPMPTAPNDLDWLDKTLEFNVYYDDAQVTKISPDRIPSPRPGQKVYFTMKSREPLGLVVLVNGINTADYDGTPKESSKYVKWVLEKDQTYIIRGYYGLDKLQEFKVGDRKAARQVFAGLAESDRYGVIELHVYRKVDGRNIAAPVKPTPEEDQGERVFRAKPSEDAESLEELQHSLRVALTKADKPMNRSFLLPGDAREKVLETTSFEGELAAKIQIRYAD